MPTEAHVAPKPSAAPVPKVAAGGIAGLVTFLLTVIAQIAKIDIPPEVAAAVVLVATFIASYFTKP